jgi:hypothetical protein
MAAAMGASGVDALPWSWKDCTLLRVYEAYRLCLSPHALRSDKSAERPSEGGFDLSPSRRSLLLLGLVVRPAGRDMLSQNLFENPSGALSLRSNLVR